MNEFWKKVLVTVTTSIILAVLGLIVFWVLVNIGVIDRCSLGISLGGVSGKLDQNCEETTPEPDASAEPKSEPGGQPVSDSKYYDDFENSIYDGGLNGALWGFHAGASLTEAEIYQDGGVLVMKSKESSCTVDCGAILKFSEWGENPFTKLEARVKFVSGNNNRSNVDLAIWHDEWSVGFGPMALEQPAVTVWPMNGMIALEEIIAGQWYTLLIEIVESGDTYVLRFSINGDSIATYPVSDIQNIEPAIQLWFDAPGEIEVHLDYVDIE